MIPLLSSITCRETFKADPDMSVHGETTRGEEQVTHDQLKENGSYKEASLGIIVKEGSILSNIETLKALINYELNLMILPLTLYRVALPVFR